VTVADVPFSHILELRQTAVGFLTSDEAAVHHTGTAMAKSFTAQTSATIGNPSVGSDVVINLRESDRTLII
jgi:hypothetical protein